MVNAVVAVDLLILDDFAIDVLDPIESRDLYDLLLERCNNKGRPLRLA